MGNRSKYLALTAAAGTALARARRARLRRAAEGIHDSILPAQVHPDRIVELDEAHASGHRHLEAEPRDTGEPLTEPLRNRPWMKHARGMTHPFSGA